MNRGSSYISGAPAWWTRPSVSIAAAVALASVLVLLAVLQYRWSGELAAAERARLRGGLHASLGSFRQEFESELARACAAGMPWNFEPRSELISAEFVWNVPEGRLRPGQAGMEPGADVAAIEQKLRPLLAQATLRPLFGCVVQPDLPALIHRGPGPPEPMRGPPADYEVLLLNRDHLKAVLLPELARRHFGSEYRIAVVTGSEHVFDSGDGSAMRPDAEMPLLGPLFVGAPMGPFGGPALRERRPAPEGFGLPPGAGPAPGAPIGPPGRGPNLVPAPGAPPWKLIAQHRAGSLDAVVAQQRRRNLALSFGVLLLLASGMVFIAVSAQRAQRLARQQMDFVAGVTHELRTPLSVISSAADNLASGTVQEPRRVAEYGALIRGAGRRLTETVEQVLLFAKIEAGARHLEPHPLAPADLVQSALAEAAPILDGIQVESRVDQTLPPVMADRAAALRCLGNLISNAVKYGGDARWLGIDAAAVHDGAKSEVQITVADRGIGLPRTELARVFEPFYRAPEAKRAQIQGTGLGLSLARDLAESMGGRISARSTPGQGSAFTLHLPAGTGFPAGPASL